MDPDLPTAPYEHHVARLAEPEAEALIARVRASAAEHAHAALRELAVEAIAIREGPSPAIPAAVADVLASRAGKALGPPWRRDHRDAAACAIAALG